MKTATTIVQNLIRLTWLVVLVLGIILWSGRSQQLLPVHVSVGVAFVLALWTLAYIGVRCKVALGLVGMILAWGLAVLVLGMTQTRVLSGSSHWIVQALHLLIGFIAMGLAEALAGRIKRELPQGSRR